MKYYNKNPKLREQWTNVAMTRPWQAPTIKVWCQNNGSKDRFWFGPNFCIDWYFENPEDALIFKLKFTGQ